MFRCEQCHNVSQSREQQYILVVEKRPKTYTYYLVKTRSKDKEDVSNWVTVRPESGESRVVKTKTTQGWEVVRETRICKQCLPREDNTSHV